MLNNIRMYFGAVIAHIFRFARMPAEIAAMKTDYLNFNADRTVENGVKQRIFGFYFGTIIRVGVYKLHSDDGRIYSILQRQNRRRNI